MAYIDGFVLAVPTGKKQKFLDYISEIDPICLELGATRVFECWGDDGPSGKLTDFQRAVQAKDDETIVFSWIEWPDKATRDAGMAKMKDDPRMDPKAAPFDGKRMIFGGFKPVLQLGPEELDAEANPAARAKPAAKRESAGKGARH